MRKSSAVAMRNMLPKMKYAFCAFLLNIVLVPIALRYWTCHVKMKEASSVERNTYLRNLLDGEKLESRRRETVRSSRKSCTPRKNIVFLKTHKTGSSTVTNILNRYGESKDLNFVLPRLGENRLDWPWFFQTDSFYPMNGSSPNILCNHARYNKRTMEQVMPNDTVYVTILRNPVEQFESTFSYMTLDKILGMDNSSDPLEKFFKDPESVLVNYVLTQDLRINSDRLKLIRNGMFYDLGLESRDFDNFTKIREIIDQIDQQFHLVMITEYFEESLVLLKRLLCWDLDDMVFFRMNVRARDWKRTISNRLERRIKRWSSADVMLYDHFNRTFWKVLRNLGPDFWEEVKMLKAKNVVMRDVCLARGEHSYTSLQQTAELKRLKLRHNIPYVAREMCKRMTWDEVKYMKYLRENFIEKSKENTQNYADQSLFASPLAWIKSRIKIM